MTIEQAEGAIEAILFAMGQSVPVEELAKSVSLTMEETRAVLCHMKERYRAENRGITLVRFEDAWQLCSKREYYDCLIQAAVRSKKPVLTNVMLETLSIIAYKQPVTRAEIEKIRGVKSDHAVSKLIEWNLIEEKGRMEVPGRPILFGTTEEFLRRFGIPGTESLPEIDREKVDLFGLEAEQEVQVTV